MKKIRKNIIIAVSAVLLIIIFFVLYFLYGLYGGVVSEEAVGRIQLDLFNNALNVGAINYDMLDDRFKAEISEGELQNCKTAEDFSLLFDKINSVDCKPNFFQKISVYSTDFGKWSACEIIADSNGMKYRIHHHIEVASTLSFEPVIVGWTVEITEISE